MQFCTKRGAESSGTQIHSMPDDVLFNIFRKCCEELSLDSLKWNPPRPRRYPVMHDVRTVCRRWWQLAEHYVYSKRYFWYTYSCLVTSRGDSLSDLVTNASRFKRSLETSQKSDIWLRFDLPGVWNKNAADLTGANAALLGLFIRFVGLIVPHQEQIVHYEICTMQPQFLSHLLNLLIFRMKRMHRHPTIYFRNNLPSLSDILSATSLLPSNLLSHPATATSSLSYPAHLKHCHLTAHNLSWSDGSLMKFPFSITELVIPEVNLFKAGDFFNAIGDDLVSLTINSERKFGLDKKELELPKECFTFPSLSHLTFSSASDSWAECFLRHTRFPCLESVKIVHLWESFCWSKPNSETRPDFFGRSSVSPILQNLHVVSVASSKSSIFCVVYFMRRTIRDLVFRPGDWWEWQSTSVSLLKANFKSIHPRRLEIREIQWTNSKTILSILSSLNLACVRELVIKSSGLHQRRAVLNRVSTATFQVRQDRRAKLIFFLIKLTSVLLKTIVFMTELISFPTELTFLLTDLLIKLGFFLTSLVTNSHSFRIKAPRLRRISFRGRSASDLLMLKTILVSLETRFSTTLRVDFSDYKEDPLGSRTSNSDVRMDRITSITSLNIILSIDGFNLLFDLLSFVPRLQQLILTAPKGMPHRLADVTCIRKLFTTLTTRNSQGILVPYLSSVKFKAEIRVDARGKWYSSSGGFLTETRAMILDCLEKRRGYRAVTLRLSYLSFMEDPIVDKGPYRDPCHRYGNLEIFLSQNIGDSVVPIGPLTFNI